VAGLEAYANELFFNREIVFPNQSPQLLDWLWETFERKPLLKKFDFALLLREKPLLDSKTRLYQDVDALNMLRNGLIHFKPEWSHQAQSHKEISKRLESRFPGSPFLRSERSLFPLGWATHGCTKWALESVLAFCKEFERLAALPYSRFEKFKERLEPGSGVAVLN
jgi:hypothetical protein